MYVSSFKTSVIVCSLLVIDKIDLTNSSSSFTGMNNFPGLGWINSFTGHDIFFSFGISKTIVPSAGFRRKFFLVLSPENIKVLSSGLEFVAVQVIRIGPKLMQSSINKISFNCFN